MISFPTFGRSADILRLPILLLLASEHALLALSFVAYPLLFGSVLGLGPAQRQTFVCLAFLVAGIGTLALASRGPMGSGRLVVAIPDPFVIPTFVAIAHAVDSAAAWGAMLLYGVLQVLGARCLGLLRALLTAEVCGIAILMLGIALLRMALPKFTGFDAAVPAISPSDCLIAAVTLLAMIAARLVASDRRPLPGTLLGFGAGYGSALAWDGVPPGLPAALAEAPVLAWPELAPPALAFDPVILLPALLLALVAIVDSAGVVIATDRLSGGTCRTAGKAARGGIAGVGLASALAALVGAMPCATSTAHLGLARASARTDRAIGIAVGCLLLAAALTPKLLVLLAFTPTPIIGAVAAYAAATLITAGIETIMVRPLRPRQSLVVGLSLLLGLTVVVEPRLAGVGPAWAQPLLGSEFMVATTAALILTLLLRTGVPVETEPVAAH